MPDLMAAMLEQKIAHPKAGANTAWVPSPTAATPLHALHYHRGRRASRPAGTERIRLTDARDELLGGLLTAGRRSGKWSAADIQQELDNNVQGILAMGALDRPGRGCPRCPTSITSA